MRSDSLPAQSQIEPDACPETAREIGVRFERASGARSDGESRPSPSGACAHAARRAMICVESSWRWDARWRQLSVGSGAGTRRERRPLCGLGHRRVVCQKAAARTATG